MSLQGFFFLDLTSRFLSEGQMDMIPRFLWLLYFWYLKIRKLILFYYPPSFVSESLDYYLKSSFPDVGHPFSISALPWVVSKKALIAQSAAAVEYTDRPFAEE